MNIPSFTVLGGGPTVLMLHGVAGGHLAFAPQVESLASAGYRAVAWDMPGYGRSPPIEPYTFKGLARSCITLIEALLAGEERARTGNGIVLLGHSIGGMVAQEVVARRPDLVRRLILCGTSAAFCDDRESRSAYLAQRLAPLQAGQTMADLADTLVPRMAGPGALPEGLRLATHCMSQVPAATYRRALDALSTFDRRADLPRIQVPTLLIAGQHDRDTPAQAMKRMAAAIALGTYLEMPGVGHWPNLEAPDEFDALVLNFLRLPRTLLH